MPAASDIARTGTYALFPITAASPIFFPFLMTSYVPLTFIPIKPLIESANTDVPANNKAPTTTPATNFFIQIAS
ncbi:hypothetical protein D3C72_1839200 [compost metagenome]